MKEKQNDMLKQAIKSLPQYAPPENLWEQIDTGLDQEQLIKEAIPRLAQYQPPIEVWENITLALSTKVISWRRRSYAIAAAVAALVMMISGIQYLKNQSAPAYTYAQETTRQFRQIDDWNHDEQEFEKILASFESQPLVAKNETYQSYRKEYEELMKARAEVINVMQQYGRDHQTIQQIKDIELARNEVVQQMMRINL